MFLVFNENGQIVSWQFTKGNGFDHVRNLLHNVKKRNQEMNSEVRTIFIDNCCQWRQKIKVFGPDVTVLLDIFHAVQRVTRKMPKKHPFYSICVQDFRLVFWLPGDYGPIRTKATPQSFQLLENINSFVQRWKDIVHNDRYVL